MFCLSHGKVKNKGQALLEAIIAISVLTSGFLGILTLLSRSLSLNRVVSDNYTATYLAAEGIEVVKNLVDTNRILRRSWNTGLSDSSFEVEHFSQSLETDQNRFLLYDPNTHLYSYNGPTQTNFKRKVTIALIGSDEIKVNSLVSWTTRGGGSFSMNLEDHFFNWR